MTKKDISIPEEATVKLMGNKETRITGVTKEDAYRHFTFPIDFWKNKIVILEEQAIHCEDGPAIVWNDGSKEYWYAGNYYPDKMKWEKRKELTHKIDDKSNRYWFRKDDEDEVLHREDGGPAIEALYGRYLAWYKDGGLHRADGKPAVLDFDNNTAEFWKDGLRHNTNGPAVVRHRENNTPILEYNEDAEYEFWVAGEQITREEYFDFYGPIKIATEKEISYYIITENNELVYDRDDGPAQLFRDGGFIWAKNGFFHREDGPAVREKDGTQKWFIEGVLHRENGPAIEYASGTTEWWLNGVLHREDGPAKEYENGNKEWWVDGKLVCLEFDHVTEYYDDEGELHSTSPSLPAKIDCDGTKEWYRHGILHRDNGPAIIHPDGKEEWYKDGERHNSDGPAIVYASGKRAWYLNGSRVTKNEFEEYKEREMRNEKSPYQQYQEGYMYCKKGDMFWEEVIDLYMDELDGKTFHSKAFAIGALHALRGRGLLNSVELQNRLSAPVLIPSTIPYEAYLEIYTLLAAEPECELILNKDLERAGEIIALIREDINEGNYLRDESEFLDWFNPVDDFEEAEEEEQSSWAAPLASLGLAAVLGALTSKKKEVKKEQHVLV